MTIFKHEIRKARIPWLIWTASISFMVVICILMYPQMESEMDAMGNMFASMGSFSAAFGMDKLNFGSFLGFYSVECGNILGLGGAFFACLVGAAALSKEEKDKTAEFLLTHPVSRSTVITEKLDAVLVQVLALNLVVFLLSLICTRISCGQIYWREMLLIHAAYLLLLVELSCVCFGISAFLKNSSLGIGMGLACILYFLNLMANMTDSLKFLKWFTPFSYCEGSDIVINMKLDGGYVLVGLLFTTAGIAAAYWHYTKKDVQ
ncbi:MAG: ABC transporter permease subunit [Lachnospiraceae bacterium]|nr:ABC transporter permease subunit [Lachnospiraceae bacterium]